MSRKGSEVLLLLIWEPMYIIVTVPSRKKSQLNHRSFNASSSETEGTLLGIVVIPGKQDDHAHVCGEWSDHVVLERDDVDLVVEQLAVVNLCEEPKSVSRCQPMKGVMKAEMKAEMKS